MLIFSYMLLLLLSKNVCVLILHVANIHALAFIFSFLSILQSLVLVRLYNESILRTSDQHAVYLPVYYTYVFNMHGFI